MQLNYLRVMEPIFSSDIGGKVVVDFSLPRIKDEFLLQRISIFDSNFYEIYFDFKRGHLEYCINKEKIWEAINFLFSEGEKYEKYSIEKFSSELKIGKKLEKKDWEITLRHVGKGVTIERLIEKGHAIFKIEEPFHLLIMPKEQQKRIWEKINSRRSFYIIESKN